MSQRVEISYMVSSYMDAYSNWFYTSVMIDDKEEMRLRDFHQYVYCMMNKASASVWLEKGKH